MAAGAHGSTGDDLVRVHAPDAEVERSDGDVVVRLSGDHDLASTEMVRAALVDAAADTDGEVTVDLREVTFMDASIVGVLLTEGRTRVATGRVRMRRPSPSARRVLEACDLSHLAEPSGSGLSDPAPARSALETWVDVPPDSGAGQSEADPDGVVIPSASGREVAPPR